MTNEPLNFLYSGSQLTSLDEIRVVDPKIKCGHQNSSKMSNNLIIKFDNQVPNSSYRAIEMRISKGSVKKYSFNLNKFIWMSNPLKLSVPSDANNLIYNICFCPFTVFEQCKTEYDFKDSIGLVVKSLPNPVKKKILIIRIFKSYSDKFHWQNKTCGIDYSNQSSTIGFSFRINGEIDEAIQFVNDFISRYSKNEGFSYESCASEFDPININSNNYIGFLIENKFGIYTNQKISVKRNIPHDIVLRGNLLSNVNAYKLAIISSDLNCDTSDVNNIQIIESSKIENQRILIFEKIMINEIGTYKLCIKSLINTEVSTNNKSLSTKTLKINKNNNLVSEWLNIGILRVKEYSLNYVSDLTTFQIKKKVVDSENTKNQSDCSLKGYSNMVQLCTLMKDKFIILSDCNNNLWATSFNIINGVVSLLKDDAKILLNFAGPEQELNWILCKELQSENSVIFLGEKYLAVIKIPFDLNNLNFRIVFKHHLIRPLDATLINETVFISDGFTRSIYSFILKTASGNSVIKRRVLKNIYCGHIQIINENVNMTGNNKFFCLSLETNSIIIFELNSYDEASPFKLIKSYDGLTQTNYVNVGYLNRPCSMDVYKTVFMSQEYILLFVAENTTGKIIIFKLLNDNILGYKVMYSRGLISRLIVDSQSNILYISSWRNYLGKLEQFIQNKPIESYLEMSFYYNIPEKYQSGDYIDLDPIKKGDYFEFFYEKEIVNDNFNNIVSLNSVGLKLDFVTGKITGKINVTGRYSMKIYGSNLLKEVETTIKIFASCPPTQQFDTSDRTCHDCPIGSYRDDQTEDLCILCSSKRPNSTTKQSGSRYFWECLCEPGYYLKGDMCIPCEQGTWKSEIGDSACSGTCGNHMASTVSGAKSLEQLKCLCLPRFYNIKKVGRDEDVIPIEILNLAGLTSNYGIKYKDIDPSTPLCVPCDIGYFCTGGDSLPKFCGIGKSTRYRFSASEEECECDKGYGYSYNGCQACSQFGYKDTVGNTPCTYCHEHSIKRDLKSLKLHSDLFRFSSEKYWKSQISHEVGLTNFFTEHLKKFKNESNNPVFVTNRLGSLSVTDCQYCISGYYFDNNVKDCFKCPYGSYCQGFDKQPKRCGLNSILNKDIALSPMNCTCPIKYGNVYINRNPINMSVECHQCPIGYFQHLESTDISCLPCPENSTTTFVGSSTIVSCIPEPGYFIQVLTEFSKIPTSEKVDQIDDESFESIYINVRNHSEDFRVECITVSEKSIVSKHTTNVLRETESECSEECLRNIYCTGFSFENRDIFFLKRTTPYTTHEVYLYDGTEFINVEFKTCKLYFFNLEISEESTDNSDLIKLCKIIYHFPFESVLCPMNHYCSSTKIPTQCHENSVTLDIGSKSIDSCLCISGYEPSTVVRGKCTPCNIGWYKDEIGNFSCKRCPDKFKTFQPGSKHSTDCACTQGYYAVVENPDRNFYINNSFIITQNSILRQGEEIPIDMDIKIDDYNRFDYEKYSTYEISLSDSLVLVPSDIYDMNRQNMDTYKIRCDKCKPNHYCPGGWFGYMDSDHETTTKMDIKQYKIHNIPYKCPYGSGVPPQSTNPSSLSHCMCLPGYMPELATLHNYHENQRYNSIDQYFTSIMSMVIKRTYSNRCSPCESGMFKEGQENSSCSGRCIEYATTYGGSVSETQCFCHYGRYMKIKFPKNFKRSDDIISRDYRNLKCSKCMEGAICPGGLDIRVVNILRNDYNFDRISIQDHVKPKPKPGYFPAFPAYNNIEYINPVWNPSNQNASISEQVDIEFVDFHPCHLEFRCGGGFSGYCSSGSTGYLCSRCIGGHDNVYFRSNCVRCQSIFIEFSRYVIYNLPLLILVIILTIVIHYNLVLVCVLLKIFIEFYLTMIPYGIISIFTKSSLKKFVPVYNRTFGHSLKSFMYLRIGCIYKILDTNNYINLWYLQKLSSLFIPMINTLLLFIFLLTIKYTINLITKIHFRIKGNPDLNRPEEQSSFQISIDSLPLFLKTLTTTYFVQIHFIWMELFQMIWCVSVSYKKQEKVRVLLHIPSELCNFKSFKFISVSIISITIIFLSMGLFLYFIIKFNSNKFCDIFRFGYRKRYKGWDSISLLRRFIISIICTFQIQINTPSTSGRLRVICSLMLSSLIGVIYLILSPYNLRSDNLFNRLQILGICINIITAFVIQGSFSYDFNYVSLVPIFLFGGFCIILFWYSMVELGRISKIDNFKKKNIRNFKDRIWKSISKISHFFTSLHTDAYITYNTMRKCITVESPFDIEMNNNNTKEKYEYERRKNCRLNKNGRDTLSLSIHQSVNKLILEKTVLTVPNFWMEFLINYTISMYNSYNKEIRDHRYIKPEDMVINPWIISKFTLEGNDDEFDYMIRVFDPENPNQLREVEQQYNKTKVEMFERINFKEDEEKETITEKELNNLVEITHTKRILEEKLKNLKLELEKLIENAKQGERAVKYVIRIQENVKNIIDTPLTNDEILQKIKESTEKQIKQTSSM